MAQISKENKNFGGGKQGRGAGLPAQRRCGNKLSCGGWFAGAAGLALSFAISSPAFAATRCMIIFGNEVESAAFALDLHDIRVDAEGEIFTDLNPEAAGDFSPGERKIVMEISGDPWPALAERKDSLEVRPRFTEEAIVMPNAEKPTMFMNEIARALQKKGLFSQVNRQWSQQLSYHITDERWLRSLTDEQWMILILPMRELLFAYRAPYFTPNQIDHIMLGLGSHYMSVARFISIAPFIDKELKDGKAFLCGQASCGFHPEVKPAIGREDREKIEDILARHGLSYSQRAEAGAGARAQSPNENEAGIRAGHLSPYDAKMIDIGYLPRFFIAEDSKYWAILRNMAQWKLPDSMRTPAFLNIHSILNHRKQHGGAKHAAPPPGDESERRFAPSLAELVRDLPESLYKKALLTGAAQRSLIDPADIFLEKQGQTFSREQGNILYEAHLIGQGETGKDGSPARPGNYTAAQLQAKAEILRRGFVPWRVDSLMGISPEGEGMSLACCGWSQTILLGMTVGEFKTGVLSELEINFFEEAQTLLKADSEETVAEMVSKAALYYLRSDFGHKAPELKGFRLFIMEGEYNIPIGLFPPEHIKRFKEIAAFMRGADGDLMMGAAERERRWPKNNEAVEWPENTGRKTWQFIPFDEIYRRLGGDES